MAQERPEEVFRVVEPRVERMIRETILEFGRARRGARSPRVLLPSRAKPANSNTLTAGGPLPGEVERIRALEQRPRRAEKGEGLDTTEIARRNPGGDPGRGESRDTSEGEVQRADVEVLHGLFNHRRGLEAAFPNDQRRRLPRGSRSELGDLRQRPLPKRLHA